MTEEEKKALIEALKKAVGEKNAENAAVLAKAQADMTEYGKVQEGTKEAVAKMNDEVQKLLGRIAQVEQVAAESAAKGSGDTKTKSHGEVFTESDELKAFVAAGGRGKSGIKAITSLGASGGPGIWSNRLSGVQQEPNRRMTIRSLLDVGTTDSNLIEWIKELVFTNNADVVSEGALKPESNITFVRADVPVRTLAHWIKATRQVLSDFKMLRTIINGRLRYGLELAEEAQLLLGDGTGENLLGLIPQATAYNNALNKTGDTFIDVIRHAMLQTRLSYYPASGIVMTPTDWHHVELTKDNENRYLMANPSGVLPGMLWGLPVVESDAMPADQFMVGSFKLAATLFDREQSGIMVSTEDQDNFVRNMVTILCEERIALAVSRPLAFVHGAFPAGSTT